MQKKKSQLLTESIAKAKIKEYETKKADPLVKAIETNQKNVSRARQVYFNK